jgi:hypothetical protein
MPGSGCHREEQSDEAIQKLKEWIASLHSHSNDGVPAYALFYTRL